MKNLTFVFLLTLVFFIKVDISFAQQVNYQVRIISLMANGDDNDGGGVAGQQDPRWKIWANDNNSGGWSGGTCFEYTNQYGLWMDLNPVSSLKTRNNCSASQIHIEMEAWEEDACGDEDTFDDDCWLNDDDNHVGRTRIADINFKESSPCQWTLHEVNNGDYYARIQIYWEPYSVTAGVIAGNQTFCGSGNPVAFTNSSLPLPNSSAGTDAYYSYQWQMSPDGSNFSDISGANSSVYNPGTISTTTYYRRKETSCNSIVTYSNVLTITINPDTETPIFQSPETIRCQSSGFTQFTATANNSISLTYSLSPLSAGSINSSTGEVTWSNSFYGDATITAVSQGCSALTISDETIVEVVRAPYAGDNNTLTICSSASSVDLNTQLGGTPDAGGIWYNPLNQALAGSLFNPSTQSSGIYYYKVIGSNPCQPDTAFLNIDVTPDTEVPAFQLPITERCQGNSSNIITATANHSLGMSYSISPFSCGTVDANTGEITWDSLYYGNATVTATSSGCNSPVSQNHSITVYPLSHAGNDTTKSLCFNELAFDMDTIVGGVHQSGGIWLDANNNTLVNSMFYPNQYITGTYKYIVSGVGTCPNDTAKIQVTVFELPEFNEVVIASNSVCQSPYNGSIEIHANHGVQPYQFSLNGGAWQNDSLFAQLNSGTYQMSIIDNNNCVNDSTFQVTTSTGFEIDTVLVTNVLCNGDSAGILDIHAPGAIEYAINGGTAQTDSVFAQLLAGSYSILVRNSVGCTDNLIVSITQPTALDADYSTVNSGCGATGSANVTVTGGVSPYTYAWSNGMNQYLIQNLPPDTLSVLIVDANLCSLTVDSIIIENNGGVGNVVVSQQSNISCNGIADGEATVSMTNGNAPYSYMWNHDSQLFNATAQQLHAGNYTVTVTDNFGCTGSINIVITEPAVLSASITQIVDVLCKGQLSGSIDLSVSGGTSPYSYNWSNSSTYEDLNNIGAGAYSVTVSDNHNCTKGLNELNVTEPPHALAVQIAPSNITCASAPNGAALSAASGGVSPYNYLWSNGQVGNQLSQVTVGTYYLVVTDYNGCETNGSVTISDVSLEVTVNEQITHASCPGAKDGRIALSLSGGNAPFTYSWSNGSSQNAIQSITSGNYSVTITDTYDCEKVVDYQINTLSAEMCIKIPTAFTPNGDGANDIWDIQYTYLYNEIEVEVFNRWGNKVFYSKGYEAPWDGKSEGGNFVPAGTYLYIVNLGPEKGIYQGTLTIIY